MSEPESLVSTVCPLLIYAVSRPPGWQPQEARVRHCASAVLVECLDLPRQPRLRRQLLSLSRPCSWLISFLSYFEQSWSEYHPAQAFINDYTSIAPVPNAGALSSIGAIRRPSVWTPSAPRLSYFCVGSFSSLSRPPLQCSTQALSVITTRPYLLHRNMGLSPLDAFRDNRRVHVSTARS